MQEVNNFIANFNWQQMLYLLERAVAVLLCLTFHETCHGAVAWKLGDPTAKSMGRISLNPFRHLDFFGTLMMLIAGFGWAKPVPVDMRYFKNPKSGMALTALAGPVSNLLLAFVALIPAAVLIPYAGTAGPAAEAVNFLFLTATLSVGLGLFNIVPIPPLDGSKVLAAVLPDRLYYGLMRYERYGMIVMVIVLYLGWLNTPLIAARSAVLNGMWAVITAIF